MLDIDGLTRRFGSRSILDRLQLTLRAGDYVAIVGESGAGKSTLLNLVAGLDTPEAGRIAIDGQVMFDIAAAAPSDPALGAAGAPLGAKRAPTRAMSEDERTRLRRHRVGFVFQAFHVLPHLTLQQNVELPLVLLGAAPAARSARAQDLLAAVGLGGREHALPRELSGGELQRVAVARALAHRPALVLADEPTGNLDPDTAAGVLALLAQSIRAQGSAGILVTHSAQAAATCDRVLRLDHGRLSPA